jgi:signal transduction histidine kinase
MPTPAPTPAILYVGSALLLALVTWWDAVSGYELGLFILYFFPVAIAAWWGSRRAGVLFACAAAVCWYGSDRFAEHPYSMPLLIYWETFMRFASYLTTALALAKVREGMRRQEDLLRVVSHDLRAPLAALSGQAQLLRRRTEGDAWMTARADAILRATGRMDGMIADLVDGAMEAAGKLRLDVQAVPLQPFVAELMGRMQGALEVERVDLALSARPPLAVKADPGRLERVIVNLVSNALKYSPAEERVRVDAEEREGRVIISVADRGPGIPPAEVAHLFRRYYRGRAARDRAGLGLGLYSTRLLVDAHGGDLTVEAAPGGGAVFRVSLPAARGAAEGKPPGPACDQVDPSSGSP